jgi:hypothetical protein
MAFADPQTVTINAVDHSLPRTSSGASSGVFTQNDNSTKLEVSSAYGKRTRRTVRLTVTKTAPDPLISSQNIVYSMTAYLVVDTPVTGFTITEQKQIVDGLTAWTTATSGAQILKLLGGEN